MQCLPRARHAHRRREGGASERRIPVTPRSALRNATASLTRLIECLRRLSLAEELLKAVTGEHQLRAIDVIVEHRAPQLFGDLELIRGDDLILAGRRRRR